VEGWERNPLPYLGTAMVKDTGAEWTLDCSAFLRVRVDGPREAIAEHAS
jgi:hypothetical protein